MCSNGPQFNNMLTRLQFFGKKLNIRIMKLPKFSPEIQHLERRAIDRHFKISSIRSSRKKGGNRRARKREFALRTDHLRPQCISTREIAAFLAPDLFPRRSGHLPARTQLDFFK